MRPNTKPEKMKSSLICKILVYGLLSVFPVDIKGQTCQCTHWIGAKCASCTVGCYLIANYWLNECRPKCFSCLSSTDCNVCKTGCYGPRCDSDCITCRHGLCTNNVCTYGCAVGYYHYAEDGYCRRCPNKCVVCNSISDCTVCIAGHTGSYCQHCKYGYYRNNGQCIQCSTNCLHGKCEQFSGQCTDGCQNGWTGLRCNDSCAPICASCQRYSNLKCISCAFGNYGSSCESKCSSNCAMHDSLRQCNESNGDCNSGCVDGWTGSQCFEKCEMNCLSCDAQDEAICHTCSPGYYGQSCETECSSNCVKTLDERNCRKSDGYCLNDCLIGYTGDKCDLPCDSGCRVGCDRKTGLCYGKTHGNQDNVVVIGGVVGSIAIVVLIIVAVLMYISIKRRRNNEADPEKSVTYESSPIDNAHCTNVTPSLGPVTGWDGIFEEINAHWKIVTPSQEQVPEGEGIYEEIDKNDDIDYEDIKDYEVPTTSNSYNI